MLPLIQMLSGNKNLNPMEMLNNMASGPGMPDMFKNMGGNNDMLSALTSLMSNGGNFNDLLKNGGGNNMLNMLPLLQIMNNQKPSASHQQKPEPIIETVQNEQKYYNLKPISKIANKDITYVLNRYFSGV